MCLLTGFHKAHHGGRTRISYFAEFFARFQARVLLSCSLVFLQSSADARLGAEEDIAGILSQCSIVKKMMKLINYEQENFC